jgi:hypothetical protein
MKTMDKQLNEAQERIMMVMTNMLDLAVETKEMIDVAGDEKVKTNRGSFSLNQIFDFKKMNFNGLIMYITISGQQDKVYRSMTTEGIAVANMIIKEQFDDYMSKEINKIFNN